MTDFSQFIQDFCTYPLSLILLAVIIIASCIWFFKFRPKEVAEKRKRDDDFIKAQERYENLMNTTTQLYQAALENSTKAIENNTAVVKILTERMNSIEDNQKIHTNVIKELQNEDRKLVEKAIELNMLVKKRG